MANVLFTRTDDPSTKAITDGQIILSTAGDGNIYLDNGTTRLKMGGDAERRVDKNDVVQSLEDCRLVPTDKIAESVPSVAVIKEIDNALGGADGVDIRLNPETGEPEWSPRGADSFSPFRRGGVNGGNTIPITDDISESNSDFKDGILELKDFSVIPICEKYGIDYKALTADNFVSTIVDVETQTWHSTNVSSLPKVPSPVQEVFTYNSSTGLLSYTPQINYKPLGDSVYWNDRSFAMWGRFSRIISGKQNLDFDSFNGERSAQLVIRVIVRNRFKVQIGIIPPSHSGNSNIDDITSTQSLNTNEAE